VHSQEAQLLCVKTLSIWGNELRYPAALPTWVWSANLCAGIAMKLQIHQLAFLHTLENHKPKEEGMAIC